MMIAQQYANDIARTAEHLDFRSERVQATFDYAAAYQAEIEVALAESRKGL